MKCSICLKDLSNNNFTNSQLKKISAERKCKNCCSENTTETNIMPKTDPHLYCNKCCSLKRVKYFSEFIDCCEKCLNKPTNSNNEKLACFINDSYKMIQAQVQFLNKASMNKLQKGNNERISYEELFIMRNIINLINMLETDDHIKLVDVFPTAKEVRDNYIRYIENKEMIFTK